MNGRMFLFLFGWYAITRKVPCFLVSFSPDSDSDSVCTHFNCNQLALLCCCRSTVGSVPFTVACCWIISEASKLQPATHSHLTLDSSCTSFYRSRSENFASFDFFSMGT